MPPAGCCQSVWGAPAGPPWGSAPCLSPLWRAPCWRCPTLGLRGTEPLLCVAGPQRTVIKGPDRRWGGQLDSLGTTHKALVKGRPWPREQCTTGEQPLPAARPSCAAVPRLACKATWAVLAHPGLAASPGRTSSRQPVHRTLCPVPQPPAFPTAVPAGASPWASAGAAPSACWRPQLGIWPKAFYPGLYWSPTPPAPSTCTVSPQLVSLTGHPPHLRGNVLASPLYLLLPSLGCLGNGLSTDTASPL